MSLLKPADGPVNCEVFLAQVRRETGLDIEIISTSEEARLVVSGCAPLLNPRIPYALVFDIGGGSTEIVLVRLEGRRDRRRRQQILGSISLPLGVVTLTDRFGGEVSPAIYRNMVDEAAEALAEVRKGLSDPPAYSDWPDTDARQLRAR